MYTHLYVTSSYMLERSIVMFYMMYMHRKI
jgi:hypothetical protein